MLLPCQECRSEFSNYWNWNVCGSCGYRICHQCLGLLGRKCNKCSLGYFEKS